MRNKQDSFLLPSRYLIAAVCFMLLGVGTLYAFFGGAATELGSTASVQLLDDCDDDQPGDDCDCDDDDDDGSLDDDCDCENRLFADLAGPTIGGQMPRGFAKFRRDDDNDDNDNRLKVFVRFVNLPENTQLGVFVDGNFVGNIRLRENGNSHSSFEPNFDITEGSDIEIRDGGDVILSGEFGCPGGTPTGTPTTSPTGTPTRTPTRTPTGTPTASPTGTPSCFSITTLSGGQEVPPNNSPGAGVGTTSLSQNQNRIFVTLSFSGLTSNAVAAHIHGPAPAGANAPIIFPLTGVPAATSGSIPPQSFDITPAQIAQFRAGLFYFNVHTVNFPGGEIRGQILPPPACTATPTGTPSGSPTGSQTGTPSGSPTGSQTGTPSGTPTGTATASPSPTPGLARLFTANLRGNRVSPPVQTSGRGLAGALLNAEGTQIQAFAAFVNLSSNQTAASINCPAIPGQNAPAVFNLGVVGGSSGLATGTFNVTPLRAAELRAGLCYVVISSQDHPSGEIRGQLHNRHKHRDFDGDGQSDVALFRPANGTWYFLNSSNGGFGAGQFGIAGDKPISGDFDGDGRGELAVYRNVNGSGIWYLQNSSDNSFVARQWGLGSDIPLAGDFDGDSRSDIAVFRPSDGNWYVSQSSNGAFSARHWGQAGDIPLSDDYDGDGTTDLAVFRPSTGTWYILRSSDGQSLGVQWGLSTDKPVTGDFDGDGLADIAVFRPSEGNWYIYGSRGSIIALHFGANGDIPVPGRFDDDEKTDMAVFRPSDGNWYILKSQTNSMTAVNFGLSGDVPISSY